MRPNRRTYRRHQLDCHFGLLRAEIFPGDAKRVELQRVIPACDYLARALGILLRVARPTVPAVGIGHDPLVAAAAKQPVDRLAARLADKIPQRDLDTTNRRHHRRATLVLVAHHAANDRFNIEWVAPKHAPFDPLVGDRLNRSFLPFERGLTNSGETSIGAQPNKEVVAQAGVGQEGLKAGDLHRGGSRSRASAVITVYSESYRYSSITSAPRLCAAQCVPYGDDQGFGNGSDSNTWFASGVM